MKYDSIFDVLGRIMVGPSSSHTAGACRIALVARQLFGTLPDSVTVSLHGSFARTYRGHRSDVAIVGGLIGLQSDDPRLRKSFELAEQNGLEFSFKRRDLGENVHPNSIQIEMEGRDEELSVLGSSIGGGNIVIKRINGLSAGFDASLPTIVTIHKDVPGVIAEVTTLIATFELNIATMQLSRDPEEDIALAWIEVTSEVPEDLMEKIEEVSEILRVRDVNV